MNSKKNELRKHGRVAIDLDYFFALNNQEFSGRISNLSLGGAYLATINPKLPATSTSQQGNLKIKCKNGWTEIKCNIVYIGNKDLEGLDGVGVAFCNEDEVTATAIWNIAVQYVDFDRNLFSPETIENE